MCPACWGVPGERGTAEKHMASNHLFAFLILKNSKGCKLRAPPRASLNCIQLQWPLMGIVHHSGQQYQHRSKPQLQNAWAVGWIMAIPSGSRYYYFSKHMAECCVIKKKKCKEGVLRAHHISEPCEVMQNDKLAHHHNVVKRPHFMKGF